MAIELTDLAPYAYGVVAIVSVTMLILTIRSYQATGNIRLMFVAVAFGVFAIKSLLVILNETSASHPIGHHEEVILLGVFDVIALVLLFIPFLAPPKAR